jgi:hypothetical protein
MLALATSSLAAQATPYVSLDDPYLALVEQLIQRGVIDDPQPMVRPLLSSEIAAALAAAHTDPGNPDGELVARLRERFAAAGAEAWWKAGGAAGAEAYSTPRRDLLHPVGDEGVSPYVELRLAAGFGNVVAVTRPAAEPRITDDPDWPGRRNVDVAGRIVEGYLSAQFKYVRLMYGQMEHNWGPGGLPGLPLSSYGYERQGLFFQLGNRTVRLSALATDLAPGPDSAGTEVNRYYFVHRLGVRVSPRLDLAIWEGNVISGEGRAFETRYRNPLSVGYVANTIGLGDRGNVMLGADFRWKAHRRATVEAQVAIDDIWFKNRQNNRDRFGVTLSAYGPLMQRVAWRAQYSVVSALALRAFNPADNFTDSGVGLGRNFSDNDFWRASISFPVRDRWVVEPEVALLRQGEGAINTPYPVGEDRQNAPTLFIGTLERTWRLGLKATGSEGPLTVSADAGLHRIQNAGHVAGVNDTELAFRVRATLGLQTAGTLE